MPITLQAGDSTASWTYNVATIRASNNTPSSYSGASFNVGSGTSCNGLTVLCGLAQETISANFLQQFNPNASSGNNLAQIGIGLNSTGAFSAASKMNNNGSNLVVDFPPALYILAPSLGLNVLAELESSNATNANVYRQQSNYELAGHMARIERSKQMAESQKGVGTDAITAIIAAILALANALDKKGALSFEEYRDALLSMYREMPHEDASGDAGHIFDGMLSQLERAIRNRQKPT